MGDSRGELIQENPTVLIPPLFNNLEIKEVLSGLNKLEKAGKNLSGQIPFLSFLSGVGMVIALHFFSWGDTGYNFVLVSGTQHNDLTFVYLVESSLQIEPTPTTHSHGTLSYL